MTRIVFMGSPVFAVPSLRALIRAFEVVGVVTQPDRPAGRGRGLRTPAVKELAKGLSLSVIQPEKVNAPEVHQTLSDWAPDLIVVAAFGQILRRSVLDVPSHGSVNVHASLLPRWRGAAPIQAAIAAGDSQTGITIMQMDEGMDTGDILAQKSIPILEEDTGGSLTEKLAQLGADALLETLPAYLSGEIQGRPQDPGKATKAPMLHKIDGQLEERVPATQLSRRVRAFQPWPGAYIALAEGPLKVLRAHAVQEALGAGRRGVLNRLPAWGTVEGSLVLDEVQPAGKKPMGGREFLIGTRRWVDGSQVHEAG